MKWLLRIFSPQSEITRLQNELGFWKLRAEEYRSLFEAERTDRRAVEDSFRVNLHQAKPVLESKLEEKWEPNESDPNEQIAKAYQEDVERHAWAAVTDDNMWEVTKDMAKRDPQWIPVLRRAHELRQQIQSEPTTNEDDETVMQ